MKIKIIVMVNDYSDGYVIIGVSSGQRFFKARLKDSSVSLTRRVGVDDFVDTNDFFNYEELSLNEVKAYVAKFQR